MDKPSEATLVSQGPRPKTVPLYTSLKESCTTIWLKYSTVGSKWAIYRNTTTAGDGFRLMFILQ